MAIAHSVARQPVAGLNFEPVLRGWNPIGKTSLVQSPIFFYGHTIVSRRGGDIAIIRLVVI